MLICDKCGAQIPEGSMFCPQCADPVTEADKVAKHGKKARSQSIPAEKIEQLRLVCPKCESQSLYEISLFESRYNFSCPNCHVRFMSVVAKVRAKNSRGYKRENRRHFSVRVVDSSDRESLIEFTNTGYHDFELRARDIAVFSYLGDQLKIVQNLTVGQYMKVSKPQCYLATYLYGSNSVAVATLRLFRDDVLLISPSFSRIVTLYYRISPAVIRRMGDSKIFKAICLAIMNPVIKVVSWYLQRMGTKCA